MLSLLSDDYFRYLWKTPDIASTLGHTYSVLDYIGGLYADPDPRMQTFYRHQTHHFDLSTEYGLCNRLDNKTSGLLYFAKSIEIHNDYKKAQQEGRVHKYYIADIKGRYRHADHIICMSQIAHHPSDPRRMYSYGYEAQTRYHSHIYKLAYDPVGDYSTLAIQIQTGKRHQIRVHLASLGYTLLGEDLYVSSTFKKKFGVGAFYHLRCVGLCIHQ